MEQVDVQKQEEQKKIEQEQKSKTSWFKLMPMWAKAGIAIVFILLLNAYMSKGGIPSNYLMYMGAIALLIWLLGRYGKQEKRMLTNEEAMRATRKEVDRMLRIPGVFPTNTQAWVGPCSGVKYIDGAATSYLIQVTIRMNGRMNYFRSLVNAFDDRYVTIQANQGEVSGAETIPVVRPVPQALKWIKEHNLENVLLRKRVE